VYNLAARLAKNLSRGYKEKRSEGFEDRGRQIMTYDLVRPSNDGRWSANGTNKSSFGSSLDK
jgi:hypothetical protein